MAHVEFTGDTQDLSTDRGYRFEFFCEQCAADLDEELAAAQAEAAKEQASLDSSPPAR